MEELAIAGGPPAVREPVPEYLPLDAGEEAAMHASLRCTPLTTLHGGHDVDRLERAFSARFGFPCSVAMSSGTASLHAAVAALGVGPGDEVITTTYSFVASTSVIVQQGATPVFCDIDARDLGLDVEACAKLITGRTRAVLAVHIYGRPMRIEPLARLCRDARIALIEDCAGAVGARVGERHAGGFGDIGCFSFNLHKLIRTGEGGMAATADPRLAEALRELRVNGLGPGAGVNGVNRLGYNYTLAQPLAALGWAQLARFDALLALRRQNRERIRRGCAGLPVRFLDDPPGVESVGYWTPLLLPPALAPLRDAIVRAANAEGARLHVGYGEPLYRVDYLRRYAEGRRFPVSEELAPRIVVLDPSPYLTPSVIDQIVHGLRKVFADPGRLAATLDAAGRP